VIYLVEPRTETLLLAGESCLVHEYEDGRIEARRAGMILPCRVFFDKTPQSSKAPSSPPSDSVRC